MIKHYTIVVTGKVQGVWYRKSTLEKASELGLSGYVKNQTDLSVCIEAEGYEKELRALLQWCAIGPKFAEVSGVSFQESEVLNYKKFEIKNN